MSLQPPPSLCTEAFLGVCSELVLSPQGDAQCPSWCGQLPPGPPHPTPVGEVGRGFSSVEARMKGGKTCSRSLGQMRLPELGDGRGHPGTGQTSHRGEERGPSSFCKNGAVRRGCTRVPIVVTFVYFLNDVCTHCVGSFLKLGWDSVISLSC